MGGKGGGSGSTTQHSTSSPPSYLMPYIGEYLKLMDMLTTGQYGLSKNPQFTKYPGPDLSVAGFNPNELQGMEQLMGASGMQGLLGGQGAMTAANILQGNMLNPSSNPELTAYYNAAAQPLTNQYSASTAPSNMSQAALSGAFGGSADAENRALSQYGFGNQLSNLAANIYEPAYQQGLQQMTQTLGLTPSITANLTAGGDTALGVGGIQQQQQQADINAQYQNQYNKAMWPYEMSNFMGQSFNQAGLGYGSQTGTTTGPPSGKGGKAGGSILSGLGLANLLGGSGSGAGKGGSSLAAYIPFFGGGVG